MRAKRVLSGLLMVPPLISASVWFLWVSRSVALPVDVWRTSWVIWGSGLILSCVLKFPRGVSKGSAWAHLIILVLVYVTVALPVLMQLWILRIDASEECLFLYPAGSSAGKADHSFWDNTTSCTYLMPGQGESERERVIIELGSREDQAR